MQTRIRLAMGLIVILIVAGMSTRGRAADETSRRVYIASSRGDDVAVIDIASRKKIADIKVGETVHGVCAPADGRSVFTTIESEKAFKIIDTATNEVVATIPLTGTPNECAATPDGHFAAVPIRAMAGSIDIIDVPKRKIAKVLPINTPHNCYNNGSNEVIYCEARGDQQKIERIDLKTLDYTDAIPVGGDPRPFVVTKDGKKIYVALSQFHGFAAVDTSSDNALQRVALPPGPPPPSPCEQYEPRTPTHGLDISPNGKELWVTSLADSKVYVYGLAAKKISDQISTGACPNWISFSPDGKYVAVSNSATDDTSIIDAATRREVARIKVGKVPKRLVAVNVPASAVAVPNSASNVSR